MVDGDGMGQTQLFIFQLSGDLQDAVRVDHEGDLNGHLSPLALRKTVQNKYTKGSIILHQRILSLINLDVIMPVNIIFVIEPIKRSLPESLQKFGCLRCCNKFLNVYKVW